MKFSRRLFSAAVGALAVAAMALPAAAQQTRQALSSESVIETIKKRGVIKIGLSLFVPWSMRDKNGDLIGFELDVGRQLAEDMGVDVEFIPTAWDGIIPALVSGKFDVIISGMSITAQRNLTVNFSDPYAFSGLTILANKDLTGDLKTLEDYNSPDVTFAARRGATPAVVIARMFPEAQVEVDAVLTAEPGNLDARTLKARLLAQNQKPEEAKAILREVLAEDPSQSDALVLLVGVTATEDPEQALDLIAEGMGNVDDTRTLRVLRIEILTRLNREEEVEAEYRELINMYPEENAFRYRLAQFLLGQGRIDDVEGLLRDIVDADPESLSARVALVQFLANVRGAEAAEQTLNDFYSTIVGAYNM